MVNFTVRPLLWEHKINLRGLCPLMICATINRKQIYFKTNFYLKKEQWDTEEKSIINYTHSATANAAVRKQISDIEHKINTRFLEGVDITPRALKHGNIGSVEFEKFAKEIKKNQKEINRVVKFGGKLLIQDIDAVFLRKYEKHERDRGMAQNTINLTFKYLRRIMRQAKAEKIIKENPFESFRVPKYVQSERIYLLESEKLKLFKLLKKKDLNHSLYNTLAWFLYGCYTGHRHSDWKFTPDMIENDALKLRAQKNGKWVVLPIGPTLKYLIMVVGDLKKPITGQKCNVMLKAIANLTHINKEITTHVARHSFATMCATNKIPQSVTAELLGVDYRTVRVYYHLTASAISEQASVLKTI